MFRPWQFYVGLRYTRAKRRNHFISFISFISILGIVLGITALITVLSVMNGFEREVRDRILGMAAHVTVSAWQGGIADWRAVARQTRLPGVQAAAPYVEGQAMLAAHGEASGVLVRGILPQTEAGVGELDQRMVEGALDTLTDGEYRIVLGRDLARALGAELGDKITVVTPQGSITPAGVLPRLKRFTVTGIFHAGMYEYDRGIALLHAADASRLFGLNGGMTGVRLKLADLFDAPAVARALNQRLAGEYVVSDWTRQHANYFMAVQQEKRVMFIILTLIVAVAAFNIVSTLVMVVTDKRADIAILRTLGATPGEIMQVFIVQGLAIGIAGSLLGMAGGVALALNVETLVPAIERAFGVQFLSPEVYYISTFPSELRDADVLRVTVTAFVLTLLATLYPAWRAARTQPAEALRYE